MVPIPKMLEIRCIGAQESECISRHDFRLHIHLLSGIDISKIPLDQKLTEADSKEANKVTSMMSAFTTVSKEIPEWTPRVVAEKASIGGLGPVAVGSPSTVADEIERWIDEADLDGFNIGPPNALKACDLC